MNSIFGFGGPGGVANTVMTPMLLKACHQPPNARPRSPCRRILAALLRYLSQPRWVTGHIIEAPACPALTHSVRQACRSRHRQIMNVHQAVSCPHWLRQAPSVRTRTGAPTPPLGIGIAPFRPSSGAKYEVRADRPLLTPDRLASLSRIVFRDADQIDRRIIVPVPPPRFVGDRR